MNRISPSALKEPFDVVIIGGNVVGSIAALALEQIGLRVALIEKNQPKPITDNAPYRLRVSAIVPVVQQFLCSLGVWQHLPQRRIQPLESMIVWEKTPNNRCQFQSQTETNKPLAWIVENDLLQQTAWQQLDQSTVSIINGDFRSIERSKNSPHYVHLSLDNGQNTTIQGSLLIGADGANSRVRQWAGIAYKTQHYRQHCIVGNVTLQNNHESTAWQRYNHGFAFAYLPLADGSCSIAWYVDEKDSAALLQQSESELKEKIQQASGEVLGKVINVGKLATFPVSKKNAETMVADDLILIGDAVRTIHPMAGQGNNLGLQDVMALQHTLHESQKNRRPITDPLTLKRIARKRSEYHFAQNGMDAIHCFFSSPIAQNFRPTLLGLANRCTLTKKHLMRVAMGFAYDLPSYDKENQ